MRWRKALRKAWRKAWPFDRGAKPGRAHADTSGSQERAGKARLTFEPPHRVQRNVRQIPRAIKRDWPSFEQRGHQGLSRAELKAKMDEVGPWRVPFRVGDDLMTLRNTTAIERILYRRDLINGTVAERLGPELANTTVLDLGCNCGFFSLDIAARGAKHVDGVDLREGNIAQARFLAEHYGIDNVRFAVEDVDEFVGDRQWDVVYNLGLLYHVLDPLGLLRKTYELCTSFAVIDTIAHPEPASGFLMMGGKDVDKPTSGRETWELHPTYLGVIDGLRYAGFSEIIEVVGTADPPHTLYADGQRSCFLAIK